MREMYAQHCRRWTRTPDRGRNTGQAGAEAAFENQAPGKPKEPLDRAGERP